MTRKTDYQYNTSGLLKRTEKIDSWGRTIVNEIRYPENIDAGVYPFMVKDNMLNYPVEQTVKINGGVAQSTLTTYMTAYGNYVPHRVYTAKIPTPISSFSAFDGITMDSHYGFDSELDYISYNRLGKVVKFQERNGVYVSYLWGYHSSHPVAKIETGFNAIISINVDDNRLSQSDEWTTVRDDVTYLKGLLSRYIGDPLYQVTLFTYKPLFGITSQTDPNGLTTFYEYDTAGRLENTRDGDGNILGANTYHYYNEN
jgi:YD repeat-containing protein